MNSSIGPQWVLSLWVRVNLRVMTMKGYFTFPKAPGLEPHHQMQFSIIEVRGCLTGKPLKKKKKKKKKIMLTNFNHILFRHT